MTGGLGVGMVDADIVFVSTLERCLVSHVKTFFLYMYIVDF